VHTKSVELSPFAAAAALERHKPGSDVLPRRSRDPEVEASIEEAILLLPSWLADPANAVIVEQMTNALRAEKAVFAGGKAPAPSPTPMRRPSCDRSSLDQAPTPAGFARTKTAGMVPLRDVLTELEADAANASEQVRMLQAALDRFLRSAA
jgi:hypothetical protein